MSRSTSAIQHMALLMASQAATTIELETIPEDDVINHVRTEPTDSVYKQACISMSNTIIYFHGIHTT